MNNQQTKQGAFKRFTSFCVSLMQKYLPDPYIFCAMLTFIVFAGAVIFTKQSPMRVIGHWDKWILVITGILNADGISACNWTYNG